MADNNNERKRSLVEVDGADEAGGSKRGRRDQYPEGARTNYFYMPDEIGGRWPPMFGNCEACQRMGVLGRRCKDCGYKYVFVVMIYNPAWGVSLRLTQGLCPR